MPTVRVLELKDGVAEFELSIAEIRGLTFEGRFKKNISVQFYGPLRYRVSMANVAVAMFSVFRSKFEKTAIHNYIKGGWVEDDLVGYAYLNHKAPIGILLGAPYHIDKSFFQHRYKIGGFVCETDRIHSSWVDTCNQLDLVFVPTQWCRDAFRHSGVSVPIMVVPHGLEPEYQPYWEKHRDRPFVFYNTFRSSSLESRKSLEELVRSFLRAFEGRDDVVLRLRTDLSPALEETRKRYDFGRLIEVDPITNLSTQDFAKLYNEVHCTVHPSKGEGFGLIPFQSIACATPVIAPHVTGMADYLTQENSIELKTSGRLPGTGEGNQSGTYYRIDEGHLVHCLQYVFQNWEIEYEKVRSINEHYRQKNTWDEALKDLVDVLDQLLSNNVSAVACREIAEKYS